MLRSPTILTAMLLTASAASADTRVGAIDATDPTWDRPTATGASLTGDCNGTAPDSLNDGVPFDLYYIRAADFTTLLDITVSSLEPNPIDFDPMIVVYCTDLDPNNPNINLISIDDDSAGYPNALALGSFFLDPNAVYAVAVSSYSDFPQSRYGNYEISLGPKLFFSTQCLPDFTGDGTLNFFDISFFITLFSGMNPAADLNHDGNFNFFDVSLFLTAFSDGCP